MSLYGLDVDVFYVPSRDETGWNNRQLLDTVSYSMAISASEPPRNGYGYLYWNDVFDTGLAVLDGLTPDWLITSLFYGEVPTWDSGPSRVTTDYPNGLNIHLYLPYNDPGYLRLLPHEENGSIVNTGGICFYWTSSVLNAGFMAPNNYTPSVLNYYWINYFYVSPYTGSQAGSQYSQGSLYLNVPLYYNGKIYDVRYQSFDQTKTVLGATGTVSGMDITASGFYNFFTHAREDYIPIRPSTDPYSQGGESDTGGGTGTFDGTSVDVDFTSLPTLSSVDTGFITLYNPTVAQLQSLASYMWSGAFDLDTFKKLFADPMQAILGLSIVPGPVPSAGTQAVKVGNISTGISMTKAASQYIDVDCGTLNVEEFWGAYLDYEPYTKAEIYLPYIGTHQIAVDDIMGKAVHIKYHIDILSGACAAEIKCGGSVLYTFIGSVAVSIPVTGNDWTNVINGVLSIAGAVGSLVATGGASAPAAAGEIASAAVNSLKPNIEKSGAVSGGGGLMAGKVPVLILTRPRQALPASQNEYTGYPSFITRSLGAVSGYTEVHKIRLGGISATDAELDEIENLLKGGVIL